MNIDPKAASQNVRFLEAYGARIELVTEPDPVTGEFLQARISRVQMLLGYIENSFWTNQYANRNAPLAHCQTTMPEIVTALDGKFDCLFCAISTCGTLRGCAE